MSDFSDKSARFQDLAAFLDGELTGPAAQQLRDRLKSDAHLQARLAEQEQLRSALRAAFSQSTPAVSADLRQRIESLPFLPASAPAKQPLKPARGPRPHMSWQLRWRQHWSSIAVAAMITILLLVVWQVSTPAPRPAPQVFASMSPYDPTIALVMNPYEANDIADRHRGCASRREAIAETVRFPTDISELPASVGEYLGSGTYPVLDLTPIGYEFWKAGACKIGNRNAVHLLYRPLNHAPGDDHAISLWIAKGTGCKKFPCDQKFQISPDTSATPILYWRHADLLYYLTGDIDPQVQRAYQRIAMAP